MQRVALFWSIWLRITDTYDRPARWASQLTPRGWRACRGLLEREQAGVYGGCLSCGSPPPSPGDLRPRSGDASQPVAGRSPRRRSGGGRRRAREGGASWQMRASPNGGVRELSGGGAAPPPYIHDAPARPSEGGGGPLTRTGACTFLYLVQEETVLALPRVSLVVCGVAVTERV